jgi:hypothetical protein
VKVAATDRLRIIVLGYVVRGPLGGMVWSNLQYLMGLAALGHDVLFVEDSDDYPSCYDPVRHVTDADPSHGLGFARVVFERIGFAGRWAYFDAHQARWHGPAADRVPEHCRNADMVLNLCGVNPLRPWLAEVPVRVLVDEDPAFMQIRHLTDMAARKRALEHNRFFTFAENIGQSCCAVPDDGLPWQPTRQPLVIDAIAPSPGPPAGMFTTVMQWDSYPGSDYGGVHYGMKSDSFGPYSTSNRPREPCSPPWSVAPRARLASGWTVIDPLPPTRETPDGQEFIAASKAEFSVAKQGYVVSCSGWFSERSVAYLASGRPVVEDTGFSLADESSGVLPFQSRRGGRGHRIGRCARRATLPARWRRSTSMPALCSRTSWSAPWRTGHERRRLRRRACAAENRLLRVCRRVRGLLSAARSRPARIRNAVARLGQSRISASAAA